MKANSDKSHLLMSCKETTLANSDDSVIKPSQKETLLDLNVDSELKLEDHVYYMCRKVRQKLYALAQIAPFMDLKQRRNMKAFIESQFGYCPLIWMFLSRGLNKKVNGIHEKALRIPYKEKSSALQELLEKDNSVSIHYKDIQKLVLEIYKVLNGLSPSILMIFLCPTHANITFAEMGHYKGEGKLRQICHRIYFVLWTKDVGSCTI